MWVSAVWVSAVWVSAVRVSLVSVPVVSVPVVSVPVVSGSARRSRGAVARSRRAVAAKPTKSATYSMVSGLTCWTNAMSWKTGHTRHAAGVVPPQVHSPAGPSGRPAVPGPVGSPVV